MGGYGQVMAQNDKPDEGRLEELDEQIEETRKDAEDAGIIEDPDEPKFYESGEREEHLDDQTIAPPG